MSWEGGFIPIVFFLHRVDILGSLFAIVLLGQISSEGGKILLKSPAGELFWRKASKPRN